ncbi:hypothetical protein MSG28_003135 [Choristoneura fumiferana]|uniref:Uncharacterized protein n=1 Tax=Choristoneura fumiferana TaxID=7141 RepID=A0ACC0KER1_CHOFU|nr:hypothetical protein MSG28_003135 [Choristoneura fumiferana]
MEEMNKKSSEGGLTRRESGRVGRRVASKVVVYRLASVGRGPPVDVNNRGKLYSGMADCFYKMARTEGLGALYKGVGANYMRLGPHTVLLLVCWDQLKILEDFLRR